MSWSVGSLVGALILTFFVSRAIRAVLPLRDPLQRALAAHIVSLLLLVLVTGFIKAYFVTFAWRQATVYVIPQLLCFAYDLARTVPIANRRH